MTVTPQTNTTLEEIAAQLMAHHTFAICGHINPDGDCIGSTLGLANALRAVGKEAHALVADNDPVRQTFSFMKGFDALIPASDFHDDVDAFVMVDVPNAMRIGEAAEAVRQRAALTITVDHHAVPERHSQLSYTDPDSASTTLLIWEIAKMLGISDESASLRHVAECCYAGLLTDTGGFMHQNTNHEAFVAATEMVAQGISVGSIATHLFQERTMASVQLDSLTVSHMQLIGQRDVVLSWISLDDMKRLDATKDDAENAIESIRCIGGINVACLLKEREGCVRGSLRAKNDVDVAAIAREFGGGGHKAAAGFTLECTLPEAISIMEHRLAEL